MSRKYWIASLALVAAVLTLATGCAPQAAQPAAKPTEAAAASQVWRVTVNESMITDSMTSTKAFVEYDGNQNQVRFDDEPRDGYQYLLLLLDIEKTRPGKEKFVWGGLSVVDATGAAYARLENDTFLELHGLARIKATDLSIGNNHGYVCFEIPKAADASRLTLVYSAQDGEQRIALNPAIAK